MNTLITLAVIASCAFAFNQPKTRFKRDGWNVDLADAITAQNESEALRLIETSVDLNSTDRDGENLLHYGAKYGLIKVVEFMIEKGSNMQINGKNTRGDTPLHWSSVKGHNEIVKILIDHGADVNSKNERGETPLHEAADSGSDLTAKILIDHGADVNSRKRGGETSLHIAVYNGYEKIVKVLIDHGADVNSKNSENNKNGETSLHLAAMCGHDKIVELLVDNAANIFKRNDIGQTVRNIAVRKGHTKIVDWLDAAVKPAILRKLNKVCNKYSVEQPSDYIAKGRPVKPEELPWMAALGYVDFSAASGISFDCGGTVISERFILTAAHCIKPGQVPIVVRLGDVNLSDQNTKNYYIKDIIRHERYSSILKRNDIALLRLVEDIVFTPDIRPACLETNLDDQGTSVKLIVSGWGANPTSTETTDMLLKAEVQTIPLSQCNETYLQYNQKANFKALKNGISQGQYCANDPVGKGDSCSGDSGGPLQIFHNSYTAHVVGIVSYGVSCAIKLPTIYTRVAYYVDWIHSHVWKEE